MVVDGKQRRILEKKNYKKFGDLFSVYKISNAHDYDNSDLINEFDYAVYSVCISYFDGEYKCITPAIIYRALTGKSKNFKLTPNLREAILNSLKKLIVTIIEIDEKQLFTYEISLLDASGIRNTFMNIMLKNYICAELPKSSSTKNFALFSPSPIFSRNQRFLFRKIYLLKK